MNIGIDIDDVITDGEAYYAYAQKYIVEELKREPIIVNDLGLCESASYYDELFGWNVDEAEDFWNKNMENVLTEVQPRFFAREIISKLRKEGHKIIIITARDSEFHDAPYLLSKNWLDRNNIEYDKLIVNAREKGTVCKNENIDLFIDDQLNNCLDVLKEGIKVIRISNENCTNKDIVDLNNWTKIYEYIGELNETK